MTDRWTDRQTESIRAHRHEHRWAKKPSDDCSAVWAVFQLKPLKMYEGYYTKPPCRKIATESQYVPPTSETPESLVLRKTLRIKGKHNTHKATSGTRLRRLYAVSQ